MGVRVRVPLRALTILHTPLIVGVLFFMSSFCQGKNKDPFLLKPKMPYGSNLLLFGRHWKFFSYPKPAYEDNDDFLLNRDLIRLEHKKSISMRTYNAKEIKFKIDSLELMPLYKTKP